MLVIRYIIIFDIYEQKHFFRKYIKPKTIQKAFKNDSDSFIRRLCERVNFTSKATPGYVDSIHG